MFVRLIHGTLEYQIRIDYIINRFSNIKVQKMKPFIRNLLRMSVYQLLYMDKIPDNSVCDEAVKLVKKTAYRQLSGFVNGVLRNIARQKSTITVSDLPTDLSVRPWMFDLLAEMIGVEKTTEFLKYSLKEHGVSVRKAGTDEVYVLDDSKDITSSDAWIKGEIIVQDYSSSLPVILADIKQGQTVLDVCAAPGGKSIQASEKVGPCGTVISCDISEKKLAKIRENTNRLKISNIRTVLQDAAVFNESFRNSADVVLADCPCSGIGTISKKPEIKNRLTSDDCISLADIQYSILSNVCEYVKNGGKLVYSTCTLDHFENQDNLHRFLDEHPEFCLVKEKIMIPSEDSPIPFDGFYIAVMEKND